MPRKTQNAVLNPDGSRFQITDKNSVVEFLKKFNSLNNVHTTDAQGNLLYVGADGKPTTENTGYPFYAARRRNGYTQYFNNDGFTDPISPENLSPQGVAKLMAKLIEVAHKIIANGGTEGEEMRNIMNSLLEFHAEGQAFIAEKIQQDAIKQALDTLTKVNGGNVAVAQAKLATLLNQRGIVTPEPAPVEPEPVENQPAPVEPEPVENQPAPVET